MKRCFLITVISALLFFPASARAACTSPSGVAAEIIYNSSEHLPQYCDGSQWIAMGPVFSPETGALVIAAGRHHSCALKTDDSIVCWGDGSVQAQQSRIAALKSGNEAPSDAEFAELRAALDTRQAYIDKLETQIGSLARDIEGLKATTGYDEGPPVWLKVITLLLLALAAALYAFTRLRRQNVS